MKIIFERQNREQDKFFAAFKSLVQNKGRRMIFLTWKIQTAMQPYFQLALYRFSRNSSLLSLWIGSNLSLNHWWVVVLSHSHVDDGRPKLKIETCFTPFSTNHLYYICEISTNNDYFHQTEMQRAKFNPF